MDSNLFSFVQKFSLTGKGLRVDDDFVDRLNHHYTVVVLLIFTVVISAKQYMGSPIQCWVPQQYPDSWESYAENYCWVKNTYFVKDRIPNSKEKREDGEISYYQWIPFVLALQAFLFYLPALLWRLSNWHAGINTQDIVSNACKVPNCRTLKERQAAADVIAGELKTSVRLAVKHNTTWIARLKRVCLAMCGGQRRGNLLTILYLLIKLCYLANVVGQVFLLNYFLDADGHMFGFQLLHKLSIGQDWEETGIFPRVTYCDFKVRALAQGRPQTIQCVLPVNLFNEKIYIFLWCWFFIVAVITLISTVLWFVKVCYRPSSVKFVQHHLKVANISEFDVEDVRHMVNRDIRNDGMFVLRLIESNASVTVTSMIIKRLWNLRKKE